MSAAAASGTDTTLTPEPSTITDPRATVGVWDPTTPPGGYVCAIPTGTGVCGEPVESEPCPIHVPHREGP